MGARSATRLATPDRQERFLGHIVRDLLTSPTQESIELAREELSELSVAVARSAHSPRQALVDRLMTSLDAQLRAQKERIDLPSSLELAKLQITASSSLHIAGVRIISADPLSVAIDPKTASLLKPHEDLLFELAVFDLPSALINTQAVVGLKAVGFKASGLMDRIWRAVDEKSLDGSDLSLLLDTDERREAVKTGLVRLLNCPQDDFSDPNFAGFIGTTEALEHLYFDILRETEGQSELEFDASHPLYPVYEALSGKNHPQQARALRFLANCRSTPLLSAEVGDRFLDAILRFPAGRHLIPDLVHAIVSVSVTQRAYDQLYSIANSLTVRMTGTTDLAKRVELHLERRATLEALSNLDGFYASYISSALRKGKQES